MKILLQPHKKLTKGKIASFTTWEFFPLLLFVDQSSYNQIILYAKSKRKTSLTSNMEKKKKLQFAFLKRQFFLNFFVLERYFHAFGSLSWNLRDGLQLRLLGRLSCVEKIEWCSYPFMARANLATNLQLINNHLEGNNL